MPRAKLTQATRVLSHVKLNNPNKIETTSCLHRSWQIVHPAMHLARRRHALQHHINSRTRYRTTREAGTRMDVLQILIGTQFGKAASAVEVPAMCIAIEINTLWVCHHT